MKTRPVLVLKLTPHQMRRLKKFHAAECLRYGGSCALLSEPAINCPPGATARNGEMRVMSVTGFDFADINAILREAT